MKMSTEEMTNRIMKFCKKNELVIKTIAVRTELDGFLINFEVMEDD